MRVTVNVSNVSAVSVMANNFGHAARKAFRVLIQAGKLKRQPRSTPDGGWENTKITREL